MTNNEIKRNVERAIFSNARMTPQVKAYQDALFAEANRRAQAQTVQFVEVMD